MIECASYKKQIYQNMLSNENKKRDFPTGETTTEPKRIKTNKNNTSPQSQSQSFLQSLNNAIRGNKINAAKLLITQNKESINAKDNDGQTALHYAAEEEKTELAELLISMGSSINIQDNAGRTPLHLAVFQGATKIVELLIDNDADVNARDSEGQTPLHFAHKDWSYDAAHELIVAGAQINIQDNEGRTPFYFAITDSDNMHSLFLDSEVDIHFIDKNGQAAIHWAAGYGTLEMVKELINVGADVNAKDNDGKTPLHCAAESGTFEMVKELINSGADVNAMDNDGKTPRHYALINKDKNKAGILWTKMFESQGFTQKILQNRDREKRRAWQR